MASCRTKAETKCSECLGLIGPLVRHHPAWVRTWPVDMAGDRSRQHCRWARGADIRTAYGPVFRMVPPRSGRRGTPKNQKAVTACPHFLRFFCLPFAGPLDPKIVFFPRPFRARARGVPPQAASVHARTAGGQGAGNAVDHGRGNEGSSRVGAKHHHRCGSAGSKIPPCGGGAHGG
jgi:hypothetical protein